MTIVYQNGIPPEVTCLGLFSELLITSAVPWDRAFDARLVSIRLIQPTINCTPPYPIHKTPGNGDASHIWMSHTRGQNGYVH
ncbi:Protein of unknown function [Pyronema omphalodes CBS 100304]|uniref:Uncharacterized protein n=1 Tax=Pyronema omphalodes (strain CBS 100304) TaxID=1076935 RepID=U4LJL5_PYROM|nr:Protein of unknown function [Pyronema omphalodes CBS 100304]